VRTHKRRWSVIGALALVLSTLAIGVASAPFATADTAQNNACLGVTGTMSTFPIPITGLGTPNPDTLPGSITLGGTSVTIGVDATLIGAGVTTGLVSAADSLADIGSVKNDGTPDPLAGVDAVTAAVGSVKLKITGTNTSQGTQTAANTAPVALTFYVTADSAGGSIVVYSSISTPPSTTPDPTRTGTVLVGALIVPIPLADTVWTPTGGNVVFSEANVTPSTTTASSLTPADKTAAPLLIGPKINGTINVPFTCWSGTASADGLTFTVTPSNAIDTVTVIAPPAAPTCASPQATSVGGGQSTTVTPSCTDINGNFTASSTSIVLTDSTGAPTANGAAIHGTVAVQANGALLYTNDGLGAPSDTFYYTATDDTALTSSVVTVNVSVLNNQCTVLAASCQLRQVLVVPVAPSTLSMFETALGGPGNPNFSTAILGGVLDATNACNPGPLQLDGQPHTVCGALNPVTVVNARGTDARWDLTGQIGDFVDGTRGPTDTCSTGRNIDQAVPDNHCIPGGNLGWVPTASISDPSVPGDTAATEAGSIIFPPSIVPGPVAQIPAPFPPNPLGARTNTNSVTVAPAGLHDAPMKLCAAPVNQSGGTFVCNAGLVLAVPGSAAAGTYTALLTLTLA
jgi:hypothetical protein